ncbi:type II secretion system protein GspM [Paraburkholderia kururiensis]|uniref:Type II secretion system protein M n=1 Tax=Paraburkholderia kururiensis TaxID=984307 RepID=A0ABZ0WRH8_9BURK|nr:type II secretion system protein M [Paraburkholderia kururiensis]WQD79946.1 type II secretion system protein M [Paraburkholderia kururiensis]
MAARLAQFHHARAALTEWFEARAPRERVLLVAGGAVLLVAFVYAVLWEPAYEGRARVAASLPLLDAQLADVRAQMDEARRLRAAAAVSAPQGNALREALAASLAQAGMGEARVVATGGSVQIDAKAVPFAAWMAWLDQVRREQHVRVVNAHANADARAGLATVSATLQPAAQQ